MKYIIIVLSFLILNCGEEAPPFRPDLSYLGSVKKGKLPYFRSENMDPDWDKDKNPEELKRFLSIDLTDSGGNSVSEKNLEGKFTIVSFFYTTCRGICPLITSHLKGLSPELERSSDFQMLSISIDPQTDSVSKIAKYKKDQSISNSNWIFVTGDKDKIYELARRSFNADTRLTSIEGAFDFVHSENIYLLDRDLYVRAIFQGKTKNSIPIILKNLEVLREESRKD